MSGEGERFQSKHTNNFFPRISKVSYVSAQNVPYAPLLWLLWMGSLVLLLLFLLLRLRLILSKIFLEKRTQTSFSSLFRFLSLTYRKHCYFPPSLLFLLDVLRVVLGEKF